MKELRMRNNKSNILQCVSLLLLLEASKKPETEATFVLEEELISFKTDSESLLIRLNFTSVLKGLNSFIY